MVIVVQIQHSAVDHFTPTWMDQSIGQSPKSRSVSRQKLSINFFDAATDDVCPRGRRFLVGRSAELPSVAYYQAIRTNVNAIDFRSIAALVVVVVVVGVFIYWLQSCHVRRLRST